MTETRSNPLPLILAIVGGIALILLLTCGVVVWLVYSYIQQGLDVRAQYESQSEANLKQAREAFLGYWQIGKMEKALESTGAAFRQKHSAAALQAKLDKHPEFKGTVNLAKTNSKRKGNVVYQYTYQYQPTSAGPQPISLWLVVERTGGTAWEVTDFKIE